MVQPEGATYPELERVWIKCPKDGWQHPVRLLAEDTASSRLLAQRGFPLIRRRAYIGECPRCHSHFGVVKVGPGNKSSQ